MTWAALIILGLLLVGSVHHSVGIEAQLDTALADLEDTLTERNSACAAQDAANENATLANNRADSIELLCSIAAKHAVAGRDDAALAILGELHTKAKP